MSEFNIKTSKTKRAVSALKGEARSVASVYNTVDDVGRNLGFRITSSARIQQRLRETLEDISDERSGLDNMGSALDKIIDTYRQTETRVADHGAGRKTIGFGAYASDKMGPLLWALPAVGALSPGAAVFSVLQLFRHWWTDDGISHWGLEADGWKMVDKSYGSEIDIAKFKDEDDNYIWGVGEKLKDFNKKHKPSLFKDKDGQVEGGRGKFIYEKGKGWKSVQTQADKDEFDELTEDQIFDGVDVTIAKVGVSKEDSFWRTPEDAALGDKDGSHLSGEIRVGNVDREAYAYIGPLSAGVSAGASVSVLHMEGEAQLGNDTLGIYGQVEVDALKAGLKGDASIGLYDKDGNFSPNVHAGVEAEAILAEASLKGGVKIAGTDIGVKGGVNVGFGAHADVGFKDGKFTADLGASLGVGLSLKVDIDVSGTVDAVCDTAKSVLDGIGTAAESAGKAIGDLGNAVGKGISDIGKGIGSLFGW